MPYKFDKEGRYVEYDPTEQLLQPAETAKENIMDFVSVPSPTNVPGVSPQEAAARPLGATRITPTAQPASRQVAGAPMLDSQAPGHKFAQANATIWNPNTGEKKAWTIGAPMPGKDWKLWTGGTATGQEAQEAIIAGQTGEEAPPDSKTLAAQQLEEREEEAPEEPTGDKWEVPSITEILEGFGIEKITPSDFSQDYADLKDWQTEQIEALDLEYDRKYEEQDTANKNSLGSLQAKLLKAGVSLDGTSYESATAGEVTRGEARVKVLDREKALAETRINSSFLKGRMDLGKQEREEVWNAQVTNINNIFKGYNLATNIWDSFNKRSQFDRGQEQSAQQHLEKMTLEYHKLDEKTKSSQLGMLENFIKDGLFDIYNEDVANMLYKMEELNGLETGSLVDSATGGYWNRMSNMALKSAQTESMTASAEKTRLTTPLTVEKMQMEIAESKARIAKMQSGASGGTKQEKEFYKDAERWRDKLANLTTPTLWGEAWDWMAKKYDIDPTRDTPEDAEAINMLDEVLGYKVWRDMDDLKIKKREDRLSEDEKSEFDKYMEMLNKAG